MPSTILPGTLNCRGRIISLNRPLIMGILNLTPDSFFDGGKYMVRDAALARVEEMKVEGVDIVDIGAYSSRPGADNISEEEEMGRMLPIVQEIRSRFPEIILSIDTFRSRVAKAALDQGVHIVNDISGGMADAQMMRTVADYEAPYILMHMQGTPQTMQKDPQYTDLVGDIWSYFVERVRAAREAGIRDIILDPGFGFGKTLEHNYELFRKLHELKDLALPVLIGISRKSMIWKLIGGKPDDVLPLSSALHLNALQQGVKLLRVHDVKPAVQVLQLYQALQDGAI